MGISGADLHDSQALIPLMRGILPIRSRHGPRRCCVGGGAVAAKPPRPIRPLRPPRRRTPLPHPWLRPALRRTGWPNARARPVRSGPRSPPGSRSGARSGRPARTRRSCCCAGCGTDTVDPWSVPASTDVQRSWGPLELGDRARALDRLRVHPAGAGRGSVGRLMSEDRAGRPYAEHPREGRTLRCPVPEPHDGRHFLEAGHGHGPGGPARGRDPPRPDHPGWLPGRRHRSGRGFGAGRGVSMPAGRPDAEQFGPQYGCAVDRCRVLRGGLDSSGCGFVECGQALGADRAEHRVVRA